MNNNVTEFWSTLIKTTMDLEFVLSFPCIMMDLKKYLIGYISWSFFLDIGKLTLAQWIEKIRLAALNTSSVLFITDFSIQTMSTFSCTRAVIKTIFTNCNKYTLKSKKVEKKNNNYRTKIDKYI